MGDVGPSELRLVYLLYKALKKVTVLVAIFCSHFDLKDSIDGTRSPENCHFPFKIRGKDKEYLSCTTVHDPDNKPWCPVEVDSKGEATKRWGHCDPALCSAGSSSSTTSSPGSNLNSRSRACQTVSQIKIAKCLIGPLQQADCLLSNT